MQAYIMYIAGTKCRPVQIVDVGCVKTANKRIVESANFVKTNFILVGQEN